MAFSAQLFAISFTLIIFYKFTTVNCNCQNPNFIAQPESQTRYVGSVVKFNCSYNQSVSIFNVNLRVNGTTWSTFIKRQNNSCSNINQRSSAIYITIEDSASCNNIQIQCEVTVLDQTGNNEEIIGRSCIATLTVKELQSIDKLELNGYNGTMSINWDPIPSLSMEDNIMYKLEIYNSTNLLNFTDDPIRTILTVMNNTTHLFIPDNPSPCDIFKVNVSTYLNHEEGPKVCNVSGVYRKLSSVAYVNISEIMMIKNSMKIGFQYTLPHSMAICSVTITATNELSNKSHTIERRVSTQLKNTITLEVGNNELPFDEHYSFSVQFSNSDNSVTVENSVKFSTYEIQTLDKSGDNVWWLNFIQQSEAIGALIVFGSTENNTYDYIPLRKDNNTDALVFNISDNRFASCSFNCTILVYAIKKDGLPNYKAILSSDSEEVTIRPAVERNHITRNQTDSESSSMGREGEKQMKIAIDVTQTNNLITFSCSVQDSNNDVLGCIFVFHTAVEYSKLTVKAVKRNTLDNITAIADAKYMYAAFPCKSSGIIHSEVIAKGMVSQDFKMNNSSAVVGITITFAVITALVIIQFAGAFVHKCWKKYCK